MSTKPRASSINGEGWVVGIGASAGGLEALGQFVSHLSKDFRGTIIIAQHLAPHSKSMMVELLTKSSPLPIEQAQDQAEIKPGTIYIAPPNHDIDMLESRILLTVADERTRPKPSVDEFFTSLARAFGEHAVGIILSGTGTDGAKGILAIKRGGGVTIAQDDRTAKYDGMPKAAVETGAVDSILPPEAIAENLIQTLQGHELRIHSHEINPAHLQSILEIIRERLGQDFRNYKLSTIQRRILKRLAFVGMTNFDDYLVKLKTTPGEVAELAKELLISVTKFFRDAEVFGELRQTLKEVVQAKELGQEIRIWVAGCATGEEAYTLSMLLLEIQAELKRPIAFKIFATDLDHDAIQEARAGIYSYESIRQMREDYAKQYFQQISESSFEVIKRVRDGVVFARQDLVQNPPFVKLDLISCRNVMIYFDSELQKKIFEIFHYALLPSGTLLLGKSESPVMSAHLFETVDRVNKIFRRINVPSKNPARGFHASRGNSLAMPEISTPRRAMPQQSLADIAYRKIVDHFQVAAVVVDGEANLLQVFGDVSPYIQFFTMQADLKLPNLLPKGIGIEIPILIRKAGIDQTLQRSRSYQTHKPFEKTFQIFVQPMMDATSKSGQGSTFYLVTFEPSQTGEATVTTVADLNPIDEPSRLHELEHELFITREHLQTVIEELGVSNEELQSLNEELSSTNEELQSTNEELETTNEELQSTNEELTTVNEELGVKSAELREIANGLENIQNSIGSPLVVLSSNLRIQRFNDDAKKIFFITGQDLGRNITSVSAACEIPDFENLIHQSITKGVMKEVLCEVQQTIYQLRVVPSYDESGTIVGAILIFIDNTDRIRTSEKLAASEERVRAIIDASPSLISLKDHLGRYLLVNHAFRAFYDLASETEILGKTDREFLSEDTANQFRDADLEVFIKRESMRREDSIATSSFAEKSSNTRLNRTLLSNRFPIFERSGRSPIGVGTISIDVTAQKEAQNALAKSEALYRAIAEDQTVFVCRHDKDGHITYANEAFARYFSIRMQEVNGRNFFNFVDPIDQAAAHVAVEAITSYHPVAQYDGRVLRWHSDKRWIRWITRGIFSPEGDSVDFQSVGFDVTDYRTQTEQLKRKEAIFGRIFESISDFISIFHMNEGELKLEALNPSAERDFGYSMSQAIGRRVDELLGAPAARELTERFTRVANNRAPESFDEELNLAGRTRHVSTTLVPIANESGLVDRVASLSRDISNYKTIENHLRHAKHAAEVANYTKSDFLASMSHELRTPLNVVLGFCQMLELGELNDEQVGYVAGIHRAGRLLLGLIEDILDISKIEAGKVKLESISFYVEDVARDAFELFESQASEKGLKLTMSAESDAHRLVSGDPSRLRQVMVNFISNAIKFTTAGSIELSVQGSAPETQGDWKFRVAVRDTGIGIGEEYKSQIFKKFSQAETGHSRRFGGTGLGLAISKELIGLMGGEVGFESGAGKGSTFWFEVSLPLVTRKTASTHQLSLKTKAQALLIPKHQLRILAVDDNVDSRTVIGLFLKKLGHSYELADGGQNALDHLAKHEFDLTLMDIQMPGMDGYETTRSIRTNPKLVKHPVIALTANAMKEDIERCFEAGMDDYVSKPVKIEDLNAVLTRWAEKLGVAEFETNEKSGFSTAGDPSQREPSINHKAESENQ